MASLVQVIDDHGSRHSDRLACVIGNDQRTYGALADQIVRFATALRELGLQPGDRLGLYLPNCVAVRGAHRFFAEDGEAIQAYVAASAAYRKGDRAAFRAYLDEWVTGPADHDAYLEQVGIRRLLHLDREYSAVSLGRHAPEGWPDGQL